ncbi:hypothetical protein LAZ67_19000892 [Cordylochernes scorpioides]|uniref:Mos1 transposase HTH domain-containing protein n=1 Tax=Cordylochernes scorpioides TaxID=51811 RepID=A0ABY6LHD4_9ARAC|nr:hypothetical protein LAZ67_19000892 [Cordylochernes scorpioides]
MPGHRKRRQFKQTDAFTRGMVIGLKRAGWSIRQIAADTHLGASTVHRLWRRWLEQGNVAIYRNAGGTRVTSARVDRRILRQAVAAPQATCTAILQHVQDTLDHSISTRTISRRLSSACVKEDDIKKLKCKLEERIQKSSHLIEATLHAFTKVQKILMPIFDCKSPLGESTDSLDVDKISCEIMNEGFDFCKVKRSIQTAAQDFLHSQNCQLATELRRMVRLNQCLRQQASSHSLTVAQCSLQYWNDQPGACTDLAGLELVAGDMKATFDRERSYFLELLSSVPQSDKPSPLHFPRQDLLDLKSTVAGLKSCLSSTLQASYSHPGSKNLRSMLTSMESSVSHMEQLLSHSKISQRLHGEHPFYMLKCYVTGRLAPRVVGTIDLIWLLVSPDVSGRLAPQFRSASVSMDLPLVNVSTCELRSVIRFFTAKNETAVNIHRNLVSVYGEGCMSIQMVRRCRSWFLEGRQNVHDDERSGRPVTATDNAAVAAVRNVVEADRRVTIDEIIIRLPSGIEIGRSSIGTIMSDVLNFRKVCARWVPRLLSENHKQQRMEGARAFLEMHRRDGDQRFSRIVTGDESWVHHSTPETKRQSMVWKKPEESAPKKAKVTISAGKVMAIVFWDCKGVLLVDYLPPNTTVNAARTKSRCKSLIFQKSYLTHLLESVEHQTGHILHNVMLLHHTPASLFRSVAFLSIAISRMKTFVHKWKKPEQ